MSLQMNYQQTLNVVIAVITNPAKQILITQRPLNCPYPNFWEFPGGKVEHDETPEAALAREVKEEVGLDILQYEFLTKIDHDTPDQSLSLLVYQVSSHLGVATCLASQQDLRWVSLHQLNQFTFPPANNLIFTKYLNLAR